MDDTILIRTYYHPFFQGDITNLLGCILTKQLPFQVSKDLLISQSLFAMVTMIFSELTRFAITSVKIYIL